MEDFLTHYWPHISAIISLLMVKLVNVKTKDWGAWPVYLRPIGFLIEMLDLLRKPEIKAKGPTALAAKNFEKIKKIPTMGLLVVILCSCASFNQNAAKTFKSIKILSSKAHEEIVPKFCGFRGDAFVMKCKDGDKDACDKFKQCYTVEKGIATALTTVLAGENAILAGKSEDKIQEFLTRAIAVSGEVTKTLQLWGVK